MTKTPLQTTLRAMLAIALLAPGAQAHADAPPAGIPPSSGICPSGSCAAPVALLAPPITQWQTMSEDLTCLLAATYNVDLSSGLTYTFTSCPATCPSASVAFNSQLELWYGATMVASSDAACGDDGEIRYTTPVAASGRYCVRLVPQASTGLYTLGYNVDCQAPQASVLTPASGGAISSCTHTQTFTVNTTGTGLFDYNWTIVPAPGNTATPSTRMSTSANPSDQFTTVLDGLGAYFVTVTVTNACGTEIETVNYMLEDRAGPDITCTANPIGCGPLTGEQPRVGGASAAEAAAAAPVAAPDAAPSAGAGLAAPALDPQVLAQTVAQNQPAIEAILAGAPSDAVARMQIAEKLAILPEHIEVFSGRDPRFMNPPGGEALSCPTPCTTGVLTQTHPYYDVFLNCGDGAFTARTGASHAVTTLAGARQNVIFGGAGGFPGTSDISLYVHNNNTTFRDPPGGRACAFNPPDTTSEPANVGIEEEWTITTTVPGLSPLTLREEMVAFGTSQADSGIRMTLGVYNPPTSTATALVGFRWQIDYQNTTDDGPGFSAVHCDPFGFEPQRFTEHDFLPNEIFDFYRIQNNTGTPIFDQFTSSAPIVGFPDTATPDRLVYGRWGSLTGSAWNYVANEGDNADFDSATLVYYGFTAPNALPVAPGEMVTRSVVIFTSANTQSCGVFRPGQSASASIELCPNECAELGATAADNCTTSPTIQVVSSTPGAPACTGNPCTLNFPNPGDYDFEWEASDSSGNTTRCITNVNVFQTPTPDLAPLREVCAGDAVMLDATATTANGCSQPLQYQFSQGATILQPWSATATYGPVTPGAGSTPYTVEVRCPDRAVCLTQDVETVEVYPYPTPNLNAPATLCSGDRITLDAAGSLANGCPVPLEYQFRDGATILRPWGTNPSHGPFAPPNGTTVYTVDVRCSATPGCEQTTSHTVTVTPLPSSAAGSDVSVCEQVPVTLDGSGSSAAGCPGGPLYEWRLGAAVVRPASPVPTYTVPFSTPGIYTYTLVVSCASNTACQTTDTVTVELRSCPMAVHFDAFDAAWQGPPSARLVEVTWRTLSERDTNYFIVERAPSASGPWVQAGFADAHGPFLPYRIEDRAAPAGSHPWYRIVEFTSAGRGDETPPFQARSSASFGDGRRAPGGASFGRTR